MKIQLYIFTITLFLAGALTAQKQNFTMEDAVLGLRAKLAPENVKQLNWLPSGKAYVHIKPDNSALLKTQVPGLKEETWLTRSAFEAAFAEINTTPPKSWPALTWLTDSSAYFVFSNRFWQLNLAQNTIKLWFEQPQDADDFDFNALSGSLAFTRSNNLFIANSNGIIPVTNENNPGITNGKPAHRSEFGITKGTFWSKTGQKLAFYRIDERSVTQYPLTKTGKKALEVSFIRYPFAGDSSHTAQIGVYDINTNKTVFLQINGPYDQYLTNICFSPDEKSIYVAIVNRAQNRMQLQRYNAQTGAFEATLFEEKNNKYVEPENPPLFVPGKPNLFIWQSQRDGYNHLYLYQTDGKMLRQLTKGNWVVLETLQFTPKADALVFAANMQHPLSQGVYTVNLQTNKISTWANLVGQHKFNGNEHNHFWFDTHSNADNPRTITLKNQANNVATLLQSKNPLADYAVAQVRAFSVKATDGTELFGKLMLPHNFDAKKQYPAIVYLYGGPHLQLVKHSWPESGNLWYDLLTQRGFIVLTLDNRGSSNRGLHFEQATFRQLGQAEMEDQLQGVAYLKRLPYVDTTRLGVHGWSFGGFLTTSLLLHHPNVFKAGVAGGPVIDWGLYEIMYTERYMDTPQENPDGYKKTNLLNYVKNLKGNLLQIHGTEDDVVLWQHSQAFVEACVEAGVQLDYFIYPGHAHNVLGKDRVHLMEKITRYFEQHLLKN